MSLNLLLVEDDAALAAMLSDDLRDYDHRVTIVSDGGEALVAAGRDQFDAVVLDRMLPSIDGVSVLQRMRREGLTMPIIMLTALGRLAEKVEGLEAGADDYMVKPVDAAELNARLHAVHRARGWITTDTDTIRAGDVVASPSQHRAWRAGKALDLSKTEFNLLCEFVRNADAVLTRAMLYERVWGFDFEPTTNVVDAFVRRLRIKLMADGGSDLIAAVRGVGYVMRG